LTRKGLVCRAALVMPMAFVERWRLVDTPEEEYFLLEHVYLADKQVGGKDVA
jgi:hypothetical protein